MTPWHQSSAEDTGEEQRDAGMYLNPLQMRSRIGIPILQQSHPVRTDYFPISHSLPLRKPKDTNQNTAEYKTKRNQPRKASAATKGGTGGWGSPLGADSRGSGLFELHWRRGLTFLDTALGPGGESSCVCVWMGLLSRREGRGFHQNCPPHQN